MHRNKGKQRRERKASLKVLRDPEKSEQFTRTLLEQANIFQDVPVKQQGGQS